MSCSTSLATVLQVCRWIWNTLFHQIVAVVGIYAIWIPIEHYRDQFSWHVILSSFGIIPLMAEALILFSNDNVWSQEILREKKYWIHTVLIFVASFLVITGIALEIDRIAQFNDTKHFQSAHAVFGLLSMIFIILALVCGPLAFASGIFSKHAQPAWFKLLHNILGQIAYIFGVICLCLGYYTPWFTFYTSQLSRIVATIATVIATVWSLIYAWKSTFKQIKSIIHKN